MRNLRIEINDASLSIVGTGYQIPKEMIDNPDDCAPHIGRQNLLNKASWYTEDPFSCASALLAP